MVYVIESFHGSKACAAYAQLGAYAWQARAKLITSAQSSETNVQRLGASEWVLHYAHDGARTKAKENRRLPPVSRSRRPLPQSDLDSLMYGFDLAIAFVH